MTRKKKHDETVQEYVLVMKEIGSRADVEAETVIQYVIDGILDETPNKLVLYGARNFSQFKDKVKLYNQRQKKRNSSFTNKVRKDVKKEGEVKNEVDVTGKGNVDEKSLVCHNCGGRGHKSQYCPNQNRGTKCFGCNKYGHIATKCSTSTKQTTE